MISRLQVWAAAAILCVLFMGAIAGGAYLTGRAHEGAERDRAALENTVGAVRVNLESWAAANAESAVLQAENQRLDGELDNARARIRNFNAPPPPGRVGRTALVDPALARIHICALQRMRREAEIACGGDPANGADGAAAHQPVPARPTP